MNLCLHLVDDVHLRSLIVVTEEKELKGISLFRERANIFVISKGFDKNCFLKKSARHSLDFDMRT